MEYDKLSPEQRHLLKVDTGRKIVLNLEREEGRKEGMEKGIEKGIEKGANVKAVEMAKMMKQDGEPIEKISKYSGLTKEQIKKL
ncbi:MAG: hypothetical protein GY940_04840 [bacterium]|nr:hypothetical protein [bacterium]